MNKFAFQLVAWLCLTVLVVKIRMRVINMIVSSGNAACPLPIGARRVIVGPVDS